MATQVNSRNVLLDIATTRTLANQKAVFVAASDLTFQYDSTGVLSGTPVIQITATKQNTTAPVTWTNNGGINLYSSATGGTVVTTDYSTGSTSTVYLRGINFYAAGLSSIRVMASISDIDVLTSSITVTKLQAGSTGVTGDSARIAYVVNTSATVPGAVTSGVGDVPPTSSAGTWSFTATSNLNVGEYMYQVEGKYSWITNTITWGNPYLSNLKVGKLESIVAQTGNLLVDTSGSIKNVGGAYASPSGFFLGYDNTGGVGAYKLSIGNKLTYDGTTFKVAGITINPTSGAISGIGDGDLTSVANNRDSVITAPGGGILVGTTASYTGALKVTLPRLFTGTMLKFTVDIYEYATGLSCTLEISGNNYSLASGWQSCTALVKGNSNSEYPVYFGHDGTKCCVWIGKNTETWSYPQVRIRDVLLGYADFSKGDWENNWVLSFDTTAITSGIAANQYSASILDTMPGANWNKVTGSTKPADYAAAAVKLAVSGTGIALSGNTCTKTQTSAWDAQCYSVDSFTGSAVCSFSTSNSFSAFVAGLNSDPTADVSYTSIDYGFFVTNSTPQLRIYESGVIVPATTYSGTFSIGDILSIMYDGQFVRYYKNGDLQRVTPARPGLKLYFDSSVYQGNITNIQFQPFANTNLSRGNNLIDPSWWSPSTTPASTWVVSTDAGGVDTFASRELPDSSYGIVWRAVSGTTSGTSHGGGWGASSSGSTNYFSVDSSKTYMFAVYTKSVSGSGEEYWGLTPNTGIVADLNTNNPVPYPYFAYGVEKITNEWHLLIGWVYPAGTTGHSNARCGAYKCSDGTLVKQGNNFNWIAGTTQCSTRAFQYKQTPNSEQIFAWPQVYLCDGSEPSFDDLLSMATRAVANSKLNKSAADILTGPITLASQGAITVGTPALDGATGKNGFYIGSTGIVATKNGIATVQITNSGDATFSGSVSVGGANFTNGVTGFWTGIDSADGQAKLRLGSADKYLMWDGGLKLVGATFGYLVLNDISNINSSLMGSSSWQTVGSRTASVNTTDSVGESGSYSYQWSIVAATGDLRISSGSASSTATIEARGTSTVVTGTLRVIVRDILNNLVATKDVSVIANLGGSSGVYATYNDSYVTAVNYSTKGVAATATATFNRSGTCTGSGSPTVETDTLSNTYWYLGSDATIGDNYWIKATLVSGGSINSGTLGTWQQLNTARSWSITSTYKTSTLLIEIAASAGGPVLGSGYVYLEARNDTIL